MYNPCNPGGSGCRMLGNGANKSGRKAVAFNRNEGFKRQAN